MKDWNLILSLDVFLFCEGSFNGGTMMTTLNGSVPLIQPYSEIPWNYNGDENVLSMPANIVDWVILELRDAASPELAMSGTVLMKKAALLRNDGKVAGMDRQSFVEFETTFTQGLFVVIHHRNHLSINSSASLSESGGVYSWNFTNNSNMVYGSTDSQKEIAPCVPGHDYLILLYSS